MNIMTIVFVYIIFLKIMLKLQELNVEKKVKVVQMRNSLLEFEMSQLLQILKYVGNFSIN
jgi:hypothetical protein